MGVVLSGEKYRLTKADIVKAAMHISGRSRSTVYSVLLGNMRSQPVDKAISLAKAASEEYCRSLERAREEFSKGQNGNGNRARV